MAKYVNMNINNFNITRRKSTRIYVGKIPIGNHSPISVQSMTNTNTLDITSTVEQIIKLNKVGADIVRVSIPTLEAAESFRIIKSKVNVPLVADIHFDYRIALRAIEYGADCLRINPGNIGNKSRVKQVIHCAKLHNIPIRIGINSGSLEKDILMKYKFPSVSALLESAMRHINYLDEFNYDQFKVSIKSSNIYVAIQAYTKLSKKIDQPLHVGITESGGLINGTVKSSIGIGLILLKGIGDTIRVSLATDPIEEVKIGFHILQALNIRSRGINFIACPTCSRQEFDVINTVKILEKKLEHIDTPMDISIIGCVVNGLGEALNSKIGITGLRNNSSLYVDGKRQPIKLNNNNIIEELEVYIKKKIEIFQNK